MRIFAPIFAGLLGLAFGSFLNVCLSRWPEGESVVKPRSHCRRCEHTLAWWENIPLASWIVLRGRCRQCKASIGVRYPLIELTVGLLWALQLWRALPASFPESASTAFVVYTLLSQAATLLFLWLLVALAALDAENLWLPNFLTLPGIVGGLLVFALGLFARVKLDAHAGSPLSEGLRQLPFGMWGAIGARLLAILVAGGLILLIYWLYWLVRKQEGIGLGDAKLMAMLGAWLGLPCTLLAFAIGCAGGVVAACVVLVVPAMRRDNESWGEQKLSFGTFLCIGGIFSTLWGQSIVDAYLRLAGF
jgi:leader peptidase (prepilin peptidase) / N-methyltransferase